MTNVQLNDPDFDNKPSPGAETKSFFEQLSPKSALIAGLVGGFMVLCTVGFIILLAMALTPN